MDERIKQSIDNYMYKKELVIIDQLRDLIESGVLIIEETRDTYDHTNSRINGSFRLVVRDMEVMEKLKEENQLIKKCIRFYADGASWQSFNLGDDIPMRSDREDVFSVPGRMARECIAKLGGDEYDN